MIDARALPLVRRFLIHPRARAQSIQWHRHQAQPCTCRLPHGNCHDFPCRCPRHAGETC